MWGTARFRPKGDIDVGVKNAFKMLYGGEPAEFRSQFDLNTSIARLCAVVRDSEGWWRYEEGAFGRVLERDVRLRHGKARRGNDFAPVFRGWFESENGGVVLRGEFRMTISTRVFMTVYFGALLLLTLATLLAGLLVEIDWWPPLTGVAMIGFGYGLVVSGYRFGIQDREWISDLITKALTGDG